MQPCRGGALPDGAPALSPQLQKNHFPFYQGWGVLHSSVRGDQLAFATTAAAVAPSLEAYLRPDGDQEPVCLLGAHKGLSFSISEGSFANEEFTLRRSLPPQGYLASIHF